MECGSGGVEHVYRTCRKVGLNYDLSREGRLSKAVTLLVVTMLGLELSYNNYYKETNFFISRHTVESR